jgi:hypothetical protein
MLLLLPLLLLLLLSSSLLLSGVDRSLRMPSTRCASDSLPRVATHSAYGCAKHGKAQHSTAWHEGCDTLST